MGSAETLDALAEELGYADVEKTRPDSHQIRYKKGWRPKLNPIQRQVNESPAIFILVYGERGSGKCLNVNEICYESDGLRRIGSMNPGVLFGSERLKASVWAFDGKNVVQATTSEFYRNETREALKWVLDSGKEITGSPIHPIWCCVWKPGELPVFRYVKLSEFQDLRDATFRIWTPLIAHPSFTRSETIKVDGIEITEGLSYALGALCGDGCLNQQSSKWSGLHFTNADSECLSHVESGLAQIGARLSLGRSSKIDYNITSGQKLRRLLRIGKMDFTSYHKRIPDFVIASPRPVVCAFLSGLFDTDGTVDSNGCVSLTTTSERLGIDTQNLLLALGIHSTRRSKKSASGRPTWNVYIMGKNASLFGQTIGFKISRKQARIRYFESENRNLYGYPEPIKELLRKVVTENSRLHKPLKAPIRFRKLFRGSRQHKKIKREAWELNRTMPWGLEYHLVETEREANRIEAEIEKRWNLEISGKFHTRDWHLKNRSLLQAYKYIPSPGKLRKFLDLYRCKDLFEPYLVADNWNEVVSCEPEEADLVDLTVPATHSFLCSGLINHNTFGALHGMVDFLYRNDNELGYIIVKEIGMGTEGGAWHKLVQDILPEWQQGLGIEFSEGTDFRTKSPYVWISNRHGGWSMCMLKSMPVAAHVEGKIRGREPGRILVDEAQNLESDTYFTSLLMQLGRRKSASEPSKLVFCCNPEGPSHWLYKRFFLMPVNEEDGTWDNRYAHFHIPYSDNKENLPPNYYVNYVLPAVANDPIAKARLVDGEWIDRPDASGLFVGVFVENVHIRGDAAKGIGLMPVLGQPMMTGWDPGSAHTSVHFVQIVPTLDKIYKLCLDELDYVGQYKPYEQVVAAVIQRMQYWEQRCNTEFRWEHISDDSAFNVFRPGTGSYDVQDIEKHSRNYVEKNGLPPRFIIKMKPAPKGEHSIAARVRMLTDDLVTGSFLLSATCPRTKSMFMYLPEDPDNRMNPRRKSRYLHNFSSLTYPFFFYHCRRIEVPGTTERVIPQYYTA